MESSTILLYLALILPIVVIYIYARLTDTYNYWKRKKVPFIKPIPIFGNFLPVIKLESSMGDIYSKAYWTYPEEKVVGVYSFLDPVLIVRDPDLIESIVIKDFNHFEDQVTVANDGGLFSNTLFQLKGNTWRSLRYKMNTCFTSSKLKLMFNQMLDCTDELLNNIKENEDIETRDLLAIFNTDVTANCVFGIKLDRNANKVFSEMIFSIFDIKPTSMFRIIIMLNFPKLGKMLGLTFMPKHVDRYIRELIRRTFEQKAKGQRQSNDYVQLLFDLKEKGKIETHSKEDSFNEEAGVTENIEITDDILNGQAFQFLAGGFEPVNNAMVLALFELARNPEIQLNIRKEINDVLSKHEDYSFEALKDMTYLEYTIQETMRFYPLLPYLFRQCTKTYITKDGLEINKGQQIAIPLTALHMDPQYFPEPNLFNPDRFDATKNTLVPNVYFPFGGGPRICLGMKFAMVEMKLALAKIMEKYECRLSKKTKLPLEMNKQAFFVKPKNEIFLNFERLE